MTIVCTQRHSLNWICEYVGISSRAYHKRLRKQRAKEDLYQYAEQLVIKNRQQKSRAGLLRIYHKEDMRSLLGGTQFERQMSACEFALKPYKSYIKTTDSRGGNISMIILLQVPRYRRKTT